MRKMFLKLVSFALFVLPSVFGFETNFLDENIDLAEGVSLISIPVPEAVSESTGRSQDGSETVLDRMAKFLGGHELHVKLPTLIEKDKLTNVFAETLKALDEAKGNGAVTGRKKGDGDGGGAVMMMGVMMAKTMAMMGLGGLGMLTMKALMVSALALMLSAIVGVKKMHSGHGDDDGGHQVHYVQAGHHHRRRRDIADDDTPLPYRGWADLIKKN